MRSPEASFMDPQVERVPDEEIVAGNTAHTRPENRAFYPALDGLRAVAFLMVFFIHYAAMPWGWGGVDVFFVLSGFLITGILYDSRDHIHRVRNFYVRRTIRIFPLYYGVMILLLPFAYRDLSWSWLVWPLYLGNYARIFKDYPLGSAGYFSAHFQPLVQISFHGVHQIRLFLGHFWSLCVEEQFYLLWPWVIFRVRSRRTLLWVCGLSVPLCLVARIVAQAVLPLWMLREDVLLCVTPFRMDSLLIGGFVALWLRGPRPDVLKRTARAAAPAALAALLAWAVWTPGHFWQQPYPYPAGQFTWGVLVIDVLSALVIVLAIQPESVVFRILDQRPLRWLGRISYGAYVWHDIPHGLYRSLGVRISSSHPTRATSAIALLATCLVAWLSFRFLESPFLELKERWTIRESTAAISRAPVAAQPPS